MARQLSIAVILVLSHVVLVMVSINVEKSVTVFCSVHMHVDKNVMETVIVPHAPNDVQ